jgi:hypothetical protein
MRFPTRHLFSELSLLATLLLAGLTGPAAAGPAPRVLEQEERLTKRIDVAAKAEALADLVGRIARETGAPLEAAEEVADERVVLFAHDRPAREVLAHVAEHFDYQWTRQTRKGAPRLVLIQDLAARKREAALRGGPEGELERLRQQLEDQVALGRSPEAREFARKSPQWRNQRLDELEEQLLGKWVTLHDGDQVHQQRVLSVPLPQTERNRLERERKVLLQATPGRYESFYPLDSAARLYSVLSPRQQEALWTGETLRFAYPEEPGRIPLPRNVAFALGEGSLGIVAHRTDEVAGIERPVPLQSLERLRGELYVERQGVGVKLRVRLRSLGSTGDAGSNWRQEYLAEDAVETRSIWTAGPTEPVLDERAAALRVQVALPAGKSAGQPGIRWADFLEAVSKQVSYPILADDYSLVDWAQPLDPVNEPLAGLLTRACKAYQRTCSFQGDYLRFRSPEWPTRRAMEPPTRLVRRWEADLAAYRSLPLRDLMEIAGRLTREQADVLQQRWRGQIPDGLSIALELDLAQSGTMLRLLHGLPLGAWRTLESGAAIPFGALPLPCRSYARRCFSESTDFLTTEGVPALDGQPQTPGAGFLEEDRKDAAWARAVLSLRREPMSWYIGTMGLFQAKDPREALEQELPYHPKLTEKDLKPVEGELVEVVLTAPGAAPVAHMFLVPVVQRP